MEPDRISYNYLGLGAHAPCPSCAFAPDSSVQHPSRYMETWLPAAGSADCFASSHSLHSRRVTWVCVHLTWHQNDLKVE